jgi:protein tyrosine phosphatase (PTP) superfamily phosphohydrolase (DUF442 family)
LKTRWLPGVLMAGLLGLGAAAAWLLWPAGWPGPETGQVESGALGLAEGGTRPALWARPMEVEGCPNLHKVSAELYRGAQPTAQGMKALKDLGIKTVINLRSFNSDRDEMAAAGVDFSYEHITMKAWHAEDKEVVRFLRIVGRRENHPVFVHCRHGADRTGTMCAIYRMAVQGWSKRDAVEEMTDGGFGYHAIWGNLLRYLDGLDIAEMKRQAGL